MDDRELAGRVKSCLDGIAIIHEDTALQAYLHRRVDEFREQWEPVLRGAGDLFGLSEVKPGLPEFVAGWLLLYWSAGLLDNVVDQDREMPLEDKRLSVSLFIGIGMIADGLRLVSESGHVEAAQLSSLLARGLSGATQGQLRDIRGVETIDEYEVMTLRKSGAIFGCILSAFVLLGERGEQQAMWWQIGELLGVSLQALNDYLGIWHIGKANDVSDLLKAQRTLPILYALRYEHYPAEERETFQRLWEAIPEDRDVGRMLAILEGIPARRFLWMVVMRNRISIVKMLAAANIESREVLLEWLDRWFLAIPQPEGVAMDSSPVGQGAR